MKFDRSFWLRILPWGLFGAALIFLAVQGFSPEEAAGCAVSISADGTHIGDLLTTSDLEIQINGLPLNVDLSETAPLVAPLSLSRETTNILTWTSSDRNLQISWNGQKLTPPPRLKWKPSVRSNPPFSRSAKAIVSVMSPCSCFRTVSRQCSLRVTAQVPVIIMGI